MRSVIVLSAALPLVAQGPESVLSRLPADAATVVVARDPMPHIDEVLGSTALQELVAATGDLQQELFGMRVDAAGLKRQIGLFRGFVPTEASIAMSAAGTSALVNLLRGLGIAAALARAEGKGDEVVLASLRASCSDALQASTGLSCVASLRLRDERMAERWFDDAVTALRSVPAAGGWQLEVEDASVTVRVEPLALLDGRARQMLPAIGVELPASWSVKWSATLTQAGGELRLQVGETAAPPLAKERLPRWRETNEQLLCMRFEPGDEAIEWLVEDAATMQALFDAVPAVGAVAGPFIALATQMSDAAPLTFAVVERSAAGLTFMTEGDYGEDVEEIVDIVPAELARCVVPAEGPFVVQALPLDHVLAGMAEDAAMRVLRRGTPVAERFAPILDFLAGEESSVFEPGVVAVSRAGAPVTPAAGAKALPMAAAALLAKAVDAESARAFMREVGIKLGDAFDLEATLWVEKDLGLGEPTSVMNPAAVPWLQTVAGSCEPHWLVVGDVLLASTDVGLTKDLLQRMRGTAKAALPGGKLVMWSIWRGDHFAALLEGVAAWQASLRLPATFEPVLRAGVTLLRQVEAFEWVGDVEGSFLRERMELRLRGAR